MHFIKLVPNIFYSDISIGLKTFVDCLAFRITHHEGTFYVVEKDGLRANLLEDKKYAEEHSPEFRLVTDDIEEVYRRVSSLYPELLHPNLGVITLRPWGAREFGLIDGQIGMVIQQW
jgi:hypothetical protein